MWKNVFFPPLYRVTHISMNLFAINHGLTTVSAFVFIEAVHQQSIHFSRVYWSVRREVLYNIASEFRIPMKTAALIESVQTKPVTEFFRVNIWNTSTSFSTQVVLTYWVKQKNPQKRNTKVPLVASKTDRNLTVNAINTNVLSIYCFN
jgi:hypothetical protein